VKLLLPVLHPKNPITNLMMRQKYARIAEELQKEFSEKK